MRKYEKPLFIVVVSLIIPLLGRAQTADETEGLHSVLEQLYDEMMPLCSQLIGVGRGLAGFAAMWYIASRVWGHLSHEDQGRSLLRGPSSVRASLAGPDCH